ncbi:MAG TPA: hypothetical protein ENI61_04130 [Ignavibacteria bacterium]|nr:hypothetical protein [Ignavibacteria bacterium]
MADQFPYLNGANGEYNYINLNFCNLSFENGFMVINYNATSATPYSGLGSILTTYPVTSSPKIFIIDRESKIITLDLTPVKGIVGNGTVGDTGNQFVIPATTCQPATFYMIGNNLYVAGFNLTVSTVPTTAATAVFTVAEYYVYQLNIDKNANSILSTTLISNSTTNAGYIFVGSFQEQYLFYTDNANFYQLDIATGVVTAVASTSEGFYAGINFIDLTAAGYANTGCLLMETGATPQSFIFLNPISLAVISQVDLPTYTNAVTVETAVVDNNLKLIYIYDSANTQIIIYDLFNQTFTNIVI